jgi:hypothetical protein
MVTRLQEINFMPAAVTLEELVALLERDWESNSVIIRDAGITLS